MFKFIGKMTATLVIFALILSFLLALIPVVVFVVPPVAFVMWGIKRMKNKELK